MDIRRWLIRLLEKNLKPLPDYDEVLAKNKGNKPIVLGVDCSVESFLAKPEQNRI